MQEDSKELESNLRHTVVIEKVDVNGQPFYKQSIVLFMHEDNVKNMITVTKQSVEFTEHKLKEWDKIKGEAINSAKAMLFNQKEEIKRRIALTDSDLLIEIRKELDQQKEWLKDADKYEAQAIENVKAQLEKDRENTQIKLNQQKKDLDLWKNAV